MKPRATLLHGPANSGKTERCIGLYLDLLQRRPAAEALFVAPTVRAVAEIKSRLVASGRVNGIRRPRILEFYGLAQRIIAGAAHAAREISPLAKTLLIQQIVQSLADQGRLSYFRPVARFEGFFQMVGDFIAELKAAAAAPEDFERATAKRKEADPAAQRDAEIAALYAEYQARLQSLNLYDREGRLWLARDLLRQGHTEFIAQDLDLLIVDGFAGFSRAEMDIIAELARRCRHTVITLTFQPGEQAGRHYRCVVGAYRLLQEGFDLTEEPSPGIPVSPFQPIARDLFTDPRPDRCRVACPPIRLLAAPGPLREVEEIAREVKRLLTAAGSPARPDDILIIFRSLSEYGDLVEDVFRDFGIPVFVQVSRRLSDNPPVRLMVTALEVLSSDAERDAVLAFLKSSYVRLDLPVTMHPDFLAAAACHSAIIKGFAEWPRQIRRYKERLEAQQRFRPPEGEEPPIEAGNAEYLKRLDETANFVSGLLDELVARIPKEGTWQDYWKALEGLIERFEIEKAIWVPDKPEQAGRDAAALRQWRSEMAQAQRIFGNRRWNLQDFAVRFRKLCNGPLNLPPVLREGKVQVMDAHESRALHFPIVFVAGLAEKEFPRYTSEDALYDDASRRDLERHGISLPPRAIKAADEMFLFYSAVTRATKQLYLTYPLTDDQGRERLRSYFVDELLALFQPDLGETRGRVCEAAPPLEAIFRLKEAVNSASFGLFRKDEPTNDGPILYNFLLRERREEVVCVLTAIAVENERESPEAFGSYDGILDDPAILKALSVRTNEGRLFSTAQFNEYGACPFAYLCKYLLKLQPLEEPDLLMGAQELGSIYHNILQDFYTQLRHDHRGDTDLSKLSQEELKKRLHNAAQNEFANAVKDGRTRDDALWRLQQELMQLRLQRFINNEYTTLSKSRGERRPAHFEIAFGGAQGRDPISKREPLILEAPEGRIRIRGTIDRIDLLGNNKFIIMDYKSGSSAPGRCDLEQGINFQLQIYILAAEQLFFPNRKLHEAYFYTLRDAQKKTLIRGEGSSNSQAMEWDSLRALTLKCIRQYVQDIGAGKFPVAPRGECRGSHCAFCMVCRHSEARLERKKKGKKPTQPA